MLFRCHSLRQRAQLTYLMKSTEFQLGAKYWNVPKSAILSFAIAFGLFQTVRPICTQSLDLV